MKSKSGFSMIEIVISLIILAVGFFPVYNLFRQGSAGTANTVQETVATNYASDLINFCKDLRYTQLKDVGNIQDDTPYSDSQFQTIIDQYRQDPNASEEANTELKIPNIDEEEAILYKRTITFTDFPLPTKQNPGFWQRIWQKIKDAIGVGGREEQERRNYVPSYKVTVKVQFPKGNGKLDENESKNDEVTFYTIIMD